MKKIYFLIALVTATILASCTKEQEDFFSDTSARRADATLTADMAVLTSAENGWLMQYFPESQQSFGGYNLIARFKTDGTVEVTDEFNADTVYTSLYSVKQSAGAVLVFDSYNVALHAYSDPAGPNTSVGSNGLGAGMDGEFEFSILKATATEVELKGKKTGNRVVLTPMADNDWTGYLDKISEVATAMKSKKYNLQLADTTLVAVTSDRTLAVNYIEDGEKKEMTIPFVVTTQGMTLYEPVEIRGQKLSGFSYIEGEDVFPATDTDAMKLAIVYPTLAELATESWWCMAFSGMGELGQKNWTTLKRVEEMLGETLQYAIFGLYDGNFGITFSSSGYWGSLLFNYTLESDDELTLQFYAGNARDNGAWYVNNAYYGNYFVAPFGNKATGPRTFKLTADDPNDPSWILMTDEADPTNTIMLYGEIIPNPLDN